MSAVRMVYRARQFWNAMGASPTSRDLDQARKILTPAQMALFLQLQQGEQAHSLNVFTRLIRQGETNQDLLQAALLHDIGKSRFPLKIWERVVIVIFKALFPNKAKHWGQIDLDKQAISLSDKVSQPVFFRHAFVIAEMHAEWGADMAAQAGSSPLTVALIRRHQEKIAAIKTMEDHLLAALQAVDDAS